jgi:hypothetical protein
MTDVPLVDPNQTVSGVAHASAENEVVPLLGQGQPQDDRDQPTATSAAKQTSARVVSLDQFRGFTVLFLCVLPLLGQVHYLFEHRGKPCVELTLN